MNKHIELVEKWLSNRDSVSLEELEANADAAYIAAADDATDAASADAWAAAASAAHAAAADCIAKYKELTA